MKSQIQIQFPMPGVWDKMTMTAVYEDAGGFIQSRTFTRDEIPADQAPALASVVTGLVSMAEPWQAAQVLARLVEFYAPEEDDPMRCVEAVVLTVEAANEQGARRIFTVDDYPEFSLTDPAAVTFFKYFTTNK